MAAARLQMIGRGVLRASPAALLAALLVALPVFALDPAVYDFSMQAGEDFVLQLTLKDSGNAVMNLTGYKYRAQFRSAAAPAGGVFATYSANLVNAAAGRLDIRLSRRQTAANDGKQGVWDLQQTDPAGNVAYILTGKVKVNSTVTR